MCSTAPVVLSSRLNLWDVPVIWDAGVLGGGESFCDTNKRQGYKGITLKGGSGKLPNMPDNSTSVG